MAIDYIARALAGSAKHSLDEFKNNPDVADIVQSKSDLDNYDTSKLTDNDIVKVLVDEYHDDGQSYYKWTNNNFVYIGGLDPYYSKDSIDDKFDAEDQKIDDIEDDIDDIKGQIDTLLVDGGEITIE